MANLISKTSKRLPNDPPLPFFILFEAMQQPQDEGLCLGPLGSIIVSEVIFGALANNELPASKWRGFADRSARRSLRRILPDQCIRRVPEIERMDQLVEFTAEIADLRQAVPAFL